MNNENEKKKFKLPIFKIVLSVIIIFLLIGIFVPVPYQVEMPGGTINLESRIIVDGEEPQIEGSFNMAYVAVIQGNLIYTLIGLVHPDWEVMKISDITAENETIDDSNKRDKIYLEQSKDFAVAAALSAAGIEYKQTNLENNVMYVDPDAVTTLKIGDKVISCEGEETKSLQDIKNKINEKDYGDIVHFKIIRNNKEMDATGEVININDQKFIGLSIATTFDIESDLKIDIKTKDSESGPSGGMMMALMVYNAVTKQDLTHGKKIVGTGTISIDGTVGEIGGIKQKIMGAEKAKADIFLVPAENYDDAMAVKKDKNYKIEIVKVSTLKDAIDYLEGLDD